MKLDLITGNDVHVLPKKHDPNQPDDSAVINATKQNFGKATLLMLIDWKIDAHVQLSVLDKKASDHIRGKY